MARVTARGPSAGLRAGSVARDITKRRDKPYKTEQSRVMAKKKKISFRTTYRDAPRGFMFVPVGTYELSERCKELSRQRSLPVTIVNGNPVSKNAYDPQKVSHHIARIGWHFRAEIVEEVCQELGYQLIEGRFVKPAELQAQHELSRMARTMAKHGIQLDQISQRETDDQVRAAIKELFPKIPEEDLKEIVNHAWEKGSQRVGTNNMLELPRRVQLATIARIRHEYTDYDRLLRAFDWAEARALVEPVCLQKLIEWRGENDEEEDNELEEIVRETIVIDDDDDDSQDEDSDESMEISHRPAVEADLAAESHDETRGRYNLRPRDTQQRNTDVRQKIGAVRQQLRRGRYQLRDGRWVEDGAPPPPLPPPQPLRTGNVIQINMPENGDVVQIDGKTFRRATPVAPLRLQTLPPAAPYAGNAQWQVSPSYPQPAYPDNRPLHDRPVASIEPHDDLRRMALAPQNGHHQRPVASNEQHPFERRREDYGLSSNGRAIVYNPQPSPIVIDDTPPEPRLKATIDLTLDSPPRRHSGNPVPGSRGPGGPQDVTYALYGRQAAQQANNGPYGGPAHTAVSARPLESSSQHMQSPFGSRPGHPRRQEQPYSPVDSQVAPVQYMPRPQPITSEQHSRPPHGHHMMPRQPSTFGVAQQPQPQMLYFQEARPSYTPQPVHGAPAVVQQVSRPFNVAGQSPAALGQSVHPLAAAPLTPASYVQQQPSYYPR